MEWLILSKEKLIIVCNQNVSHMTEEAKQDLIKQMIGFDFTSEIGKVIGKVIDVEIINPDNMKVKCEIYDESISNKIKEGMKSFRPLDEVLEKC